MEENEFLNYYIQNSKQIMWFLGAGTSRSAGIPTATDIVWDLKKKYYCNQENQDIEDHDINKKAIKEKIQSYFDSKGYPKLGSKDEYSFYFELMFGTDYDLQQRYIKELFSPPEMHLSIGHRALAAILEMGIGKIVFTTNFDKVLETAFSKISGKNLPVYHLEGSYAALNALNNEDFPIYAKIHGDFRYKSIKNLERDLLKNDEKIQECFKAAANRYGLIVSGYSGRDDNVMNMFRETLEQDNAFPKGIFWATTRESEILESVRDLIELARKKDVKAHTIETGSFDIMLSRIWRQISEKPRDLELKVQTSKILPVCINLPQPGKEFPVLRTNALAITDYPNICGMVECAKALTYSELKEKFPKYGLNITWTYIDKILFWGTSKEIFNVLGKENINTIEDYSFENPVASIAETSFVKAFFEEALAKAICSQGALVLRKRYRTYYAVVNDSPVNKVVLKPLKDVIGDSGAIAGKITGSDEIFWAEAVSLKLEEKNGILWLLLKPDIWISPLKMREEMRDFLRRKKIHRYNNKSHYLLNAWIEVLFGGVNKEVEFSSHSDTAYPSSFKINTQTAYSKRG